MVGIIYISHPELETLYPLTKKDYSLPNQHLLGEPIANRIVKNLKKSGFNKIVIAYPRISTQVKASLEDDVKIIDTKGLTLWEAIKQSCNSTDENEIILLLGTYLVSPRFFEGLLVKWNEQGGEALITVIPPEEALGESGLLKINVEVDFLEGKALRAIELTEGKEAISSYSFGGIIVIDKQKYLGKLTQPRSIYYQIIELINKEKIGFYLYTEKYTPLNSAWALLDATKTLLSSIQTTLIHRKAEISPTAVIEGPVIIDEEAVIDHYSVIKGPAYIGKRALVGTHSFVRNYVTVEEKAIIGSGSEVKRSYIGVQATIGSKSHVTDSVVGNSATIRPLVVTLNYNPREALKKKYIKRGSIIGEHSIINGGTVIPPRKTIPPETIYP